MTDTKRSTVAALEDSMVRATPVLDHGFVRVVDYMGDDFAIVQAARVSYGDGTKSVRDDEGLIRYLMRHQHTTPFEMCEIKLHVKMPIFVARQWIRHRMANINEISARYSILDKEFYVPEMEHIAVQSTDNKQGRDASLSGENAAIVQAYMKAGANNAFDDYAELIDDYDVARELARVGLPLSTYTQFYWKVDLHNLLNFLKLRMDSHAQYEIRAYASAIADFVVDWVPMAYKAFENYKLNAVTFSAHEMEILKSILSNEFPEEVIASKISWEGAVLGLSDRETKEMQTKLGVT